MHSTRYSKASSLPVKNAMNPITSQEEISQMKWSDLVTFQCQKCERNFTRPKKQYNEALKGSRGPIRFCSNKCSACSTLKERGKSPKKEVECKNCSKMFCKRCCDIKKTKNNFCSKSCAATYNNTHKTSGNRKSKLEEWLESQLRDIYPNLIILFNRKDIINSELDIYIPSLKLAFELNGIFHYEPIFGEDKLSQIQNNDHRKFQACLEKNIELCIIDSSQQKKFTEVSSQKYLDIITNLVNLKLSSQNCVEVL